jgi:hypothetical protein
MRIFTSSPHRVEGVGHPENSIGFGSAKVLRKLREKTSLCASPSSPYEIPRRQLYRIRPPRGGKLKSVKVHPIIPREASLSFSDAV